MEGPLSKWLFSSEEKDQAVTQLGERQKVAVEDWLTS